MPQTVVCKETPQVAFLSARSAASVLIAMILSVSCATAGQAPQARNWACTPNAPDITIDLELYPEDPNNSGSRCLVRVKPPEGATGNPKACRDKKVKWEIRNTCGSRKRVSIAFSPFEKNSHESVGGGGGTGDIEEKIRIKARATRPQPGPGPCPANSSEICGPSYKYDIYIDGVLALDPELEVEY